MALEAKLPKLLTGEVQPASISESLALAELCENKMRYAAAASFCAGAFAAQPGLAADLNTGHRYSAACAAALAGCGQGKDAAGLDEKERGRLRQQALDWLRADLAAWNEQLKKDTGRARPLIIQKMQHWLNDTDFIGVRGPDALAKLPEAERLTWQKLWADVADTLAQAQKNTLPHEKSGTQ